MALLFHELSDLQPTTEEMEMTIRVTVKNEAIGGKTAFTTLVDPATQQPYAPSRPLAPGETHEYYVHKQAKLEVHEPVED